MIGQILGHYKILEQIGAGGMGVVYRAHDERLERDVALKVLPSGALADESARKRFRKEALALAKLNHPNIEAVYEFSSSGESDFLVMEYVPGVTLSDKLAAGPLPEKEVLRLGAQLAEGLAAAHEQNIIHRDLKPGNLRLTPDGRLKILDFGLAKLVRPESEADVTESVTSPHAAAGTLSYMAPEQLQGEAADARSDIYAAGVVLYEMATGRRPFDAKLATPLADAILHQAPVAPRVMNAQVSAELERIILKCLEKNPDNRYQSARELLVDLRRLSAPLPLAAEPAARPAWTKRQFAAFIAAAVVLVLAAALLGFNAGGVRDRLLGRAGGAAIRSLAVLPLANLSHDPEQDYFAEGMTEELITNLSRIGALRVISRTSVMRYKGTQKPLPEIARELNVDAVIEGSVLRAGDRVRITAQLIRAVPEQHTWANSYDRDLRDILALHSEVAQAIAREIRIVVSPDENLRLASARRVNPEAYEDYLKGRYYMEFWTGQGYKKGIEYLQSAIEKDPTFAPTHAALSISYSGLAYWGHVPSRQVYPKAKAAALRAVELDDSLAPARHALSKVIWWYDWDVAAAERELKRALALDSSAPGPHLWYAMFLATVRSNRQEAMAEARRAQELDPALGSISTRIMAAWIFVFVREYDQAIQKAQEVVGTDPNYPQAYYVLGLAAIGQSRPADAVAPFEKAVAVSRDSVSLAYLASAYALAGQRAKAQALLHELSQKAKQEYVSPMRFVWVYASLGDRDSALKWLEKSYEERGAMLWWLKVSPLYDPLRSDPRFQDLLRRMNFPP